MASLTDIALNIQNTLNAIQSNTANTESAVLQVKADTGAMNLKLDALKAVNQAGFFNLSLGLAQVINQQFVTNQQLKHQIAQNDIIICWLEIIANLLCDIRRRLDASYAVQVKIEECLELLKDITELVHGSEAIQAHSHKELETRIEECCPPPRPEPKPCFEVCPEPPRGPEVPRPDYRPLPRPEDQPNTPGGTSRPPG